MAVAGTGFLAQTVGEIRGYISEPIGSTKWSDENIITKIKDAWGAILSEVNRVSASRVFGRFNITVVADRAEYILPPTFGRFIAWEKLTEDGRNLVEWEAIPRHPMHVAGPSFTIEPPILRLDPVWSEGDTLRITYVPNGCATAFEATTAAGGWDTSTGLTVTCPTAVTDGTRDTRASAYLGYTLRVLSTSASATNVQQERPITGYNNITRVFTVAPALSPIPTNGGSDTITFEVVPASDDKFKPAIVAWVAKDLAHASGDDKRASALANKYRDHIRDLRLHFAQANERNPIKFERAIRHPTRRHLMGWA